MTSKECILNALKNKSVDRVPFLELLVDKGFGTKLLNKKNTLANETQNKFNDLPENWFRWRGVFQNIDYLVFLRCLLTFFSTSSCIFQRPENIPGSLNITFVEQRIVNGVDIFIQNGDWFSKACE